MPLCRPARVIPAAATYTVSLRARFISPNQTLYWHVLGVTPGTTLTLTNGGIPQVITQPGVKSLLKVSPASGNGTGNWVSYSNSFTVSAQDAADYQYLVVALVASRTTGWVAQFDDVYTTVPAETTDSAAGLTAEWFDTPNPVHALSEITWSSAIRTTKEEQINWLNTSTAPFVTGVPMDRFAVRLTGRLSIPTAGDWTLFLGADDGTLLTVDGTTLLAADSEHSFTTRQATATLSAGTHAIEVRFFENGGSQGLVMSWLGPGMTAAEVVPASAFRSPLRIVRWRPVSADE